MDILIPNSWLRDFLKTDATDKKIAECLSLCGPSVDKIEKIDRDSIYFIEITTNRVDSVSVYGIAREASVILPRFGIKANFNQLTRKANYKFVDKVSYLKTEVNHELCPRFTAVLIKNVSIKPSPQIIQERLNKVGVRPLNNVVDISNYIMHELGQPVHTFDYDKIKGSKMVLRESKKGEKLTTLDGKTHNLSGGDIVIEDGTGRLIDLAGIMGGKNSEVDSNTKNVLLFVQTYNLLNIRRTSMSLGQRTEAAVLFEKGLDPELVALGIEKGIGMFEKLTEGKSETQVLDLYPKPHKTKTLSTNLEFINHRLGVKIAKKEVSRLLTALGFETSWSQDDLQVKIPSFRANDINIPEDIVEEVARIYGYHNLSSQLMTGLLPDYPEDIPFDFEIKVKNTLKGFGAVEIYNYSMVPSGFVEKNALRLKNPLGSESEYMRDSLRPSLVAAAKQNSGEKEPFHLFEMANIYIPRIGKLPYEKMTLAGVLSNYSYRDAKGEVESLLDELNINAELKPEDGQYFQASKRVEILINNKFLGVLGVLEEKDFVYYEFDLEMLRGKSKQVSSYAPIAKYPAQIEDITLILPERTRVGEVVASITTASKLIQKVELTKIYKDSYTFRVWYQHPEKTLTDKEVEQIRTEILKKVENKFGVSLKD